MDSVTYNPVPNPEFSGDNDDGNGWEQITDIFGERCSGFTIESRGSSTVGESMTLKVWLG